MHIITLFVSVMGGFLSIFTVQTVTCHIISWRVTCHFLSRFTIVISYSHVTPRDVVHIHTVQCHFRGSCLKIRAVKIELSVTDWEHTRANIRALPEHRKIVCMTLKATYIQGKIREKVNQAKSMPNTALNIYVQCNIIKIYIYLKHQK